MEGFPRRGGGNHPRSRRQVRRQAAVSGYGEGEWSRERGSQRSGGHDARRKDRPHGGLLGPRRGAAGSRDRSLVRFEKWQALGNDYLIVEAGELPWELSEARIKRICDPHFGVGSDGILLLSA